jgi:8-amino-7-oxononanoate synthase
VLDFTSACYLGLRHASQHLPPWAQLTTGVPAALAEAPISIRIAADLAPLLGGERATLAPSTLHLFWDLFGMFAMTTCTIHLDSGAYATAQWGVERASARGVPTWTFRHHDWVDLRGSLLGAERSGRTPVIVTDGLCPGCGRSAPLERYAALAREFRGLLVVDDTQALGVVGPRHAAQLSGPETLVVASLAKGLGVPLAVLAGCPSAVRRFKAHSETRVHASPPSFAHLHAASYALAIYRREGGRLRRHLMSVVRRFRGCLATGGVHPIGGTFPGQSIPRLTDDGAAALHQRLLHQGVNTVLHRLRCEPGAAVSFLITNQHSPIDIDRAATALTRALAASGLSATAGGNHELQHCA